MRFVFTTAFIAPVIVLGCADAGKDVRPDRAAEGLLMLAAGDTDRAFNHLSDVVEDEYDNPAAHRAYIQAAIKTRRLAEVVDEYRGRAAKEPRWVAPYALGIIAFTKGPMHAAEALSDLRAAAALAPNLPDVHYRLGIALLEMEEMKEACASLARCSGLDPKNPSYRPPFALCLPGTAYGTLVRSVHCDLLASSSTVFFASRRPATYDPPPATCDTWGSRGRGRDGPCGPSLARIPSCGRAPVLGTRKANGMARLRRSVRGGVDRRPDRLRCRGERRRSYSSPAALPRSI